MCLAVRKILSVHSRTEVCLGLQLHNILEIWKEQTQKVTVMFFANTVEVSWVHIDKNILQNILFWVSQKFQNKSN